VTPASHLVLILGCTVHPDGTPSKALRRRVAAALERASSLPSVRFLAVGGARGRSPAEATVIARLLRESGIGASAIVASPLGRNTIESLRACWPLLQAERAAEPAVTLHVCTDGYHTLRCQLILALWGLRSRAAPAPRPPLPCRQLLGLRWRDRGALLKDVPLALLWRAAGLSGHQKD
jgi:vancomycin permeability regulator SanA